MTDEHVVPEDFPREMLVGSLAGSSPKLLMRKVGDRYFAGLTPDELYKRYDACEDVAQQLAVYTQRKIDTEGWGFDETLHRAEMGVENKVRQIMSEVDSRPADDVPISTAEAAKLLFVSRPHVVKLIEEGTLPLHHVTGRNRFVLTSAVLAYKAKKEAEGKAYFATQTEDSEPLGL